MRWCTILWFVILIPSGCVDGSVIIRGETRWVFALVHRRQKKRRQFHRCRRFSSLWCRGGHQEDKSASIPPPPPPQLQSKNVATVKLHPSDPHPSDPNKPPPPQQRPQPPRITKGSMSSSIETATTSASKSHMDLNGRTSQPPPPRTPVSTIATMRKTAAPGSNSSMTPRPPLQRQDRASGGGKQSTVRIFRPPQDLPNTSNAKSPNATVSSAAKTNTTPLPPPTTQEDHGEAIQNRKPDSRSYDEPSAPTNAIKEETPSLGMQQESISNVNQREWKPRQPPQHQKENEAAQHQSENRQFFPRASLKTESDVLAMYESFLSADHTPVQNDEEDTQHKATPKPVIAKNHIGATFVTTEASQRPKEVGAVRSNDDVTEEDSRLAAYESFLSTAAKSAGKDESIQTKRKDNPVTARGIDSGNTAGAMKHTVTSVEEGQAVQDSTVAPQVVQTFEKRVNNVFSQKDEEQLTHCEIETPEALAHAIAKWDKVGHFFSDSIVHATDKLRQTLSEALLPPHTHRLHVEDGRRISVSEDGDDVYKSWASQRNKPDNVQDSDADTKPDVQMDQEEDFSTPDTMLVRRRVVRTQKVPRRTMLSSFTEYHRDLNSDEMDLLVKHMSLSSMMEEEYSIYEYDEVPYDDTPEEQNDESTEFPEEEVDSNIDSVEEDHFEEENPFLFEEEIEEVESLYDETEYDDEEEFDAEDNGDEEALEMDGMESGRDSEGDLTDAFDSFTEVSSSSSSINVNPSSELDEIVSVDDNNDAAEEGELGDEDYLDPEPEECREIKDLDGDDNLDMKSLQAHCSAKPANHEPSDIKMLTVSQKGGTDQMNLGDTLRSVPPPPPRSADEGVHDEKERTRFNSSPDSTPSSTISRARHDVLANSSNNHDAVANACKTVATGSQGNRERKPPFADSTEDRLRSPPHNVTTNEQRPPPPPLEQQRIYAADGVAMAHLPQPPEKVTEHKVRPLIEPASSSANVVTECPNVPQRASPGVHPAFKAPDLPPPPPKRDFAARNGGAHPFSTVTSDLEPVTHAGDDTQASSVGGRSTYLRNKSIHGNIGAPHISAPPPPPQLVSVMEEVQIEGGEENMLDSISAGESASEEIEELDADELRLLMETGVFNPTEPLDLDVVYDEDDSMDEDDWRVLQLSRWSPNALDTFDDFELDDDSGYDKDSEELDNVSSDCFTDVEEDDISVVIPVSVRDDDCDIPHSSSEEEEELMFLGDSAVSHLPYPYVASAGPMPAASAATMNTPGVQSNEAPVMQSFQEKRPFQAAVVFGIPHPPAPPNSGFDGSVQQQGWINVPNRQQEYTRQAHQNGQPPQRHTAEIEKEMLHRTHYDAKQPPLPPRQ